MADFNPRYTRESIIAYADKVKQAIGSSSIEPKDWIKSLGGDILIEGKQDKIVLKGDELVFVLANDSTPCLETKRKLAVMLGHLFIHMKRDGEDTYICCPFSRGRCWRNEQYNAEIFAMQMLMPRIKFEDEIIKNTIKALVNMNEVAKIFNVNLRFAIDWGKKLELLRWL